jgi:hypothetical protein
MKNGYLKAKTASDIDAQVGKILRDLGNPNPPLRLEEVRQLLKLDRQYYTSAKDGVVNEMVHKIKVAGKQIMHRPRGCPIRC